ncbi:MAG: DUF4390 domain-containing protein [Desulfobacterales bacterium]
MKKDRMRSLAIIGMIFILLIFPHPSGGQEAGLANIIVTNTRDDLLIYLNVEGAFQEKMNSAVASGVSITFSFFINLYRVRNLWLDKKIEELKLTHTLKYDSLRNEYVITRSWDNGKPVTTDSFEEAKKTMVEIDSVAITPLKKLKKGDQYQIRAKAELSKKTLPFHLHHVFFFISLWDFETDWYTIDFVY